MNEINFQGKVDWKTNECIKFESCLLRTGTFTDATGKEATITKEHLKKIYDSVDRNTNVYLQHFGSKIPVGFTNKYFLSDDGEELWVSGLVFDDDIYENILMNGVNGMSAELNYDSDQDILYLTGMAIVPNPAIPGTWMRAEKLAFSEESKVRKFFKDKGLEEKDILTAQYLLEEEKRVKKKEDKVDREVSDMSEEENKVNEQKVENTEKKQEPKKETEKKVENESTQDYDAKINELKNELEEQKKVVEQYEQERKKRIEDGMEELKGKLSQKGIDATNLIDGLSSEQAYDVLNRVHKNVVINTKTEKPPDSTKVNTDKNSIEEMKNEYKRKLGYE